MLLTDHFHLVLSLRMSGVILLLPLSAFMTHKGTTLHVSPSHLYPNWSTVPIALPLCCWKKFSRILFHIALYHFVTGRVSGFHSEYSAVELSASAFLPASRVFHFLWVWFSVIFSPKCSEWYTTKVGRVGCRHREVDNKRLSVGSELQQTLICVWNKGIIMERIMNYTCFWCRC